MKLQDIAKLRVNGNAHVASVRSDTACDVERGRYPPARGQNHGPIDARNLAGAEASFITEKNDETITQRIAPPPRSLA